MNEKDMVTRAFLKDNDRFSDVINIGMFHGKEILSGEKLKDEKDFIGTELGKTGRKTAIHKYRDIIKKSFFGVNFALIEIENQTDIHYAMPVRVMGYDAFGYEEQVREIRKKHRKEKDLSDAEFVSGFSKKDKVHPVLTLVVYYGEKLWDGPESLFEMIDWGNIPDEVKEKVVNYPLYVLDVRHFSENEQLKTDARIVFGFLQRQDDTNQLKQYVKDNEKEFSDIQEDAYDMISVLSDSKKLIEYKSEYAGKEGEYNMCKAIMQMQEEARELGKAESIIELLEMNGSVSDAQKNIIFSQKDTKILSQWLKKAAKTESIEEFFESL